MGVHVVGIEPKHLAGVGDDTIVVISRGRKDDPPRPKARTPLSFLETIKRVQAAAFASPTAPPKHMAWSSTVGGVCPVATEGAAVSIASFCSIR